MENQISLDDLVLPIFIVEGSNISEDVKTMPGIKRRSVDLALDYVQHIYQLGIKMIVVFPLVPDVKKSLLAEESYNPNGLVYSFVTKCKASIPELLVATDVALDPYTTHGQDGILDDSIYVDNDITVEVLVKQALSHAMAGADIIAPSDMMDGRVLAIREALEINGNKNTKILSYSAKYASYFYGPFRDAVGSNVNTVYADKFSYQLDFHKTANEALREAKLDIDEGADIIMVKPAVQYLDVIYQIKSNLNFPTFAYHVSGEYAMLKFAAIAGAIDEKATVFETLSAIKRAGADAIVTYYAEQVAIWINKL